MPLYDYVIDQGVIIVDTSTLQAQVESEYRAALGQDLVTTPDTPEGLLIAAEVSARDAVVRNNAKLANQINPNYAGGVFLDALWALTGGSRDLSTSSQAICQLTGVAGTIVSTAVRFRSESGDLWAVSATTVLDSEGLGSAPVLAVVPGPISAPANSINVIVTGVLGLETVNNLDAAILGTITQSDQNSRRERRQTLGLQGVGLPTAVMSSVLAKPDVRSMSFRENVTNAEIIIEGVTLAPHSIYACVDGGTDEDVAFGLLRKSLGCGFNGLQTVTVVDPSSNQPYTVRFSRPELIPVLIRVTIAGTPPLVDPQSAVRQAILAYANGQVEGEDGFVVGGDVSPFEIGGAVNRQTPSLYVRKVEVAKVSDGIFSTDEIEILLSQKATVTASQISVVGA